MAKPKKKRNKKYNVVKAAAGVSKDLAIMQVGDSVKGAFVNLKSKIILDAAPAIVDYFNKGLHSWTILLVALCDERTLVAWELRIDGKMRRSEVGAIQSPYHQELRDECLAEGMDVKQLGWIASHQDRTFDLDMVYGLFEKLATKELL